MIDDAVKSRLGDPIEIPLPLEEEIKRLYNNQFKSDFQSDFLDILNQKNKDELIRKSIGMSGRDIKNLCENIKKDYRYNDFKNGKDKTKQNDYFKDILNEVFKNKIKNIIAEMRIKGLDVHENIQSVNNLYGKDVEKIKRELVLYINEVKESTSERQERESRNIKKQNGILLYGPPGNGKTELVKSICKNNNLIFVGVNGKSFVGNTEKKSLDMLDSIFEDTYKLSNICSDDQGVVLFFDEFDSLVGTSMSSTIRGLVLTKLSEDKRVDGIRHSASKILLFGATNFYTKIDEAVKRPGRFDSHFVLKNPRKEDAIKIIKETFSAQKIMVMEEKLEESFYSIIREEESQKNEFNGNISSERYDIDDKEFGEKILFYNEGNNKKEYIEYIQECRKKYLCSGSAIKNYIDKLKRFLYNEKSFDRDVFKLNEEMLKKFKER